MPGSAPPCRPGRPVRSGPCRADVRPDGLGTCPLPSRPISTSSPSARRWCCSSARPACRSVRRPPIDAASPARSPTSPSPSPARATGPGWFGRVGADPFGDVVLRTVRGEGVDTSRVQVDPDAPTGLLVRDSHSERPIEVLYFRRDSAGSRLSPADVDADYVGSARILHFSGITPVLSDSAREASVAAFAAARAAGRAVTFDPNIRRRLCRRSGSARCYGPSPGPTSSSPAPTRPSCCPGPPSRCRRPAGSSTREPGSSSSSTVRTDAGRPTARAPGADPVRVHSVDPVGAGDAFAAGFLSGMLTDSPGSDDIDVPGALARAAALGAARSRRSVTSTACPAAPPDSTTRPSTYDAETRRERVSLADHEHHRRAACDRHRAHRRSEDRPDRRASSCSRPGCTPWRSRSPPRVRSTPYRPSSRPPRPAPSSAPARCSMRLPRVLRCWPGRRSSSRRRWTARWSPPPTATTSR